MRTTASLPCIDTPAIDEQSEGSSVWLHTHCNGEIFRRPAFYVDVAVIVDALQMMPVTNGSIIWKLIAAAL